jgi:hypothetical protein
MRRDTSLKEIAAGTSQETKTVVQTKQAHNRGTTEYIPGLVAPQSEGPFRGHPAPHYYG